MSLRETQFYRAMFSAVRQTFENMAFVEVLEQAAELPPTPPTEPVWVSLLINDPLQGELRLALPQTMLAGLTASMFGIEPEEVTREQEEDIIAELLNTLAGLFMTSLLPADQTYKLGLPEHGMGDFPLPEEDSVAWYLQIEESPLLLVASGAGLMAKVD